MPGEPGPEFHQGARARVRPARTLLGVVAVTASIAVAAGAIWAIGNPQRIADQLAVWNYEPTDEILAYAERATMTADARFLFFASRPVVAAEAAFDQACENTVEGVGILGCYLVEEKTIFLYDVTDERLDGIEEVVASHEMLHAAWDRMTAAERDEIGTLLEAEYAKLQDDEAYSVRLAHYEKTEPGERLNELHSIIGTEVREIGSELEAHYARYFADRSSLTALSEASSAVFLANQERIEVLVAELDLLTAQIESDYALYNSGYDSLNAEIDSFNRRADDGSFSSEAQFDRERNLLQARQDELDAAFVAIEAKVAAYDQMLVELESLNAEAEELNVSINIEPRSGDDL